MEEKSNREAIFLSIVGIATLLVAVIGGTFAWFSATVTGNTGASSVIVNTANIGITYTNGQEINLANAIPNATQTKSFTVKNTSAVSTKYKLKWVNVTNGFAVKSDLVYSISGTGTGAGQVSETVCPSAAADIQTVTIGAGITHTYSMTVTFKETGSNQNSNQGKKFTGKIEVEAVAG